MDFSSFTTDTLDLLDIAVLRYRHTQARNSERAKEARRLAHEIEDELRKRRTDEEQPDGIHETRD
jgi:hypothetical protein